MTEKNSFVRDVRINLKSPVLGFLKYWNYFGGGRALLGSIYLWVAIGISLFLNYYAKDLLWVKPTLAILPNLLGFTVAAYAILVAFGDEEFKKIIVTYPKRTQHSFFMTVNGTFCHFIITQSTTLVYAVVFEGLGLQGTAYKIIGMVLLLYSLLFAVAVALAMLTIAETYQEIMQRKLPESKSQCDEMLGILKEIHGSLTQETGARLGRGLGPATDDRPNSQVEK